MRHTILMAVLGILILCSGCIRSLQPFYTEQDLLFEQNLIGQWAEDGDKEIWAFSKKGMNSYTLVFTDDEGRKGQFVAHLVKIKGKRFLDIFPEELELKENNFYKFHFLPIHTFLYVEQIIPTLQMRFPDADWLKKFIAGNTNAIQHDIVDDEIILTAPPKELQAFWLKHLNTEGAFAAPSNMTRKQVEPPKDLAK